MERWRPADLLGLLPVILCSLLMIGAAGCAEESSSDGSEVLVRVGEQTVTSADLETRKQVERIGSNTEPAEDSVVVILIREAYERELARVLGVEPTAMETATVAARLDEIGRPGLLDSIRGVFENDTLAYLRHIVEPQARVARLQKEYLRQIKDGPAGKEDSREKMNRGLGLVAGSGRFADVASSLLLTYRIDTLYPEAPPDAEVMARYGEHVTTNPVLPLLDSLDEGESLKQVLEDRVGYQIVRLLDRDPERLIVEIIEGPKYSYGAWFRDQIKDINISAEEGSGVGELVRRRFTRE